MLCKNMRKIDIIVKKMFLRAKTIISETRPVKNGNSENRLSPKSQSRKKNFPENPVK